MRSTLARSRIALFCASLVVLALMATGCERDTPLAPDTLTPSSIHGTSSVDPQRIASDLVRLAGWETDATTLESVEGAGAWARTSNSITNYQRQELGGGIAHYSFEVRFGPGPYELIGVHRVVKEQSPGRVGRIAENLFLLHGDAKDFTGMFLPGVVGPSTPDDFGLAIYLAENGIDVWGMDQGWCFIPADETDPSVAAGWGLQRSADDLRLGVAVARMSRLLTGSGGAPLNVLGYSSGVPTIYTAANDEAVMPRGLRNIGGLVPADFFPKTDDASWAQFFCDDLAFVAEPALAAGEYLSRIPFDFLAEFYLSDPAADSPIIPGFTNDQVFWFFLTSQIFGEETFHYFGGQNPGDDGLADEFRFVQESWVIDFLAAGIKFQPMQFFADYDRLICGEEDVPWDDNFHLIEVPILNLAARGGADEFGLYTQTLVGSDDFTSVVASTLPIEDILVDFGHIDLFLSPLARDLAWVPLLEWVLEHTPRRGLGPKMTQHQN